MPKVTVCVPVYNVEKYIERCARSLFEQTLDDIEFIFVDDCTPDRSIEILESEIEEYKLRFAEKNYTVRIVRMPTNSGLAAVRRQGIQFATGEYIIHCDSDDWVEPAMYQVMYEKAINTDADVVICDYKITDGNTYSQVVKGCHANTPVEFVESCLFQRDSWSLCNKLFKRKVYYKDIIYPEGAMGEDMVTVIQLMCNCKTLAYTQFPIYNYYTNPSSITKLATKDSYIRKYEQLFANSKIVIHYLESQKISVNIQNAIVSYKNFIRSVLYPIVWDKTYYEIWNTMYSGLNRQVLLSRFIPWKEKIRVILTILHLYPRVQDRAK